MNVACLVPYPLDRVPGQRFRLEQWAPRLKKLGHTLVFFPFVGPELMDVLYRPGHFLRKSSTIMSALVRRFRSVAAAAADFDVVVIHREAVLLGVDWFERYLSKRVPTVYDFDDAVWLPNVSNANRRFSFLKGFKKVERIMALVSVVSAGSEYLASHARRFNEQVTVTPTSIDLDLYGPPRSHRAADVLTVGWSGSATTAAYLQLVADALRAAAAQIPMRLVVLGADLSLHGIDVECIPWSPEVEVEVIRSFDVGIKPVPREPWVLGKCPMKDIQYMALGVPAVATRYGTALESIQDQVNGFLCGDADDWVAALQSLTETELRVRLGAAGRRAVEERYSARVSAETFSKVLERAHSAPRPL